MLASVLLTKLPPEIRLIVTRKASGEDLDLEMLQGAFEEELVARDAPVIWPRTTVVLKISLGHPLQPPYFSQEHKNPAESPLLVATANSRTPQLIVTL